MGATAEAFVAYAQPLIDETDGSHEQVSKALAISQLCYNLALLPEERRDQMVSEMRGQLEMGDDEFEDFRRTIISPMLQRHREMFSQTRGGFLRDTEISRDTELGESTSRGSRISRGIATLRGNSTKRLSGEAYPGTRPYAPCPCNSGKKYKFCCRMKK